MRSRWRRPSLLALLAALAVGTGAAPARGQVAEPKVTVSPASSEPGGRVQVWLDNWPLGVVTVQVCGNSVQRGSQDCDHIGARSISIRDSRTVQFLLLLTRPPVGCPCVIRVATSGNDLVRAAPIDLIGVPGNTDIPAVGGLAESATVKVRSKVVDQQLDFPESWLARFGGDAKRNLVLDITNQGSAPLTNLRVTGQVGRKAGSGEPISSPVRGEIAPGQHRRVVVPFDISAPAYGDYVVSGSVYGLAQPVRFRATTSNDPWALEVAVILFVVALALLARRRERKARRQAAEQEALAATGAWVWVPIAPPLAPPMPGQEAMAGQEAVPGQEAAPVIDLTEEPAPSVHPVAVQSSPDVGVEYDGRCEPHSYDLEQRGAPDRVNGAPAATNGTTNGARSASSARR